MTYTDTIVRQLLVTLKKDFRAFESDLKEVWDNKMDQDFSKLEEAEKDLAKQEAEETSAQADAEKAAKEAEAARAKAVAKAQSLNDARIQAPNPKSKQHLRRVETVEKEAEEARSLADECDKSAESAKRRAVEAAKLADAARTACQSERARLEPYQPYNLSRNWLRFKSEAAIRSINLTIRSQQSVTIVKNDLNILHKELRARSLSFFAHVKTFSTYKADGVKKAQETFESISQNLFLFNSVSDGELPQQRFFQIHFAAKRAVTRFERAHDVFEEWANHWDPYFQGRQNLTKVGTLIACLITRSDTVEKTAFDAALSCEIEFHRDRYSKLCEELNALYEEYSETVCILDHLQASPDLEPTFLPRIYRRLDRAGYFIEHSLSALKAINLVEKDRPAQLTEAWKLLVAETKEIAQNHSALYANPQSCAQSDRCRPQIQQVGAYAREGLSYALAYQQDPACPHALKGQSEAISKMEMALDGLRGAGLRPRVFDQLWWAMVQINLILSGCPDEEEKCLVTDKQLDTYIERLKTILIGAGCYTHRSLPSCDRQPADSLLSLFQTEPQAGATMTSDHTSSAAHLAERFKNTALMAARLKLLVPEGMRPPLEEIVKQAEFLRQKQASGGTPSDSMVKQLSRRLNDATAMLKATCAVALDKATGVEKEQIKALDEKIFSDTPGRQSDDYPIGDLDERSAFDPAAKSKGGVSL